MSIASERPRHMLRCEGGMQRETRSILIACAALLVAAMVGCQSKPEVVEARGGGRSMVLDSPRMRQLTDGVTALDESRPWYESRNDARLTTNAGYATPTYES